MREQADFAALLRTLMADARRANSDLAQLTGISVRTIENWTAGEVRHPRHWQDVLKLAHALGLNLADTTTLLLAAGHPPLMQLQAQAQQRQDAEMLALLASWGRVAAPHAPLARHQLRTPIGDFVGRAAEIAQLRAALLGSAHMSSIAAITGVQGMGGIGKTELAYRVAHEVRHDFPDAQIVLALHGSSATPLRPEQALQTVLRAFLPDSQLPDDLRALETLYRSQLDSKRVLVFADDAANASQVEPLLPPVGCALLVTSRARFTLPAMTTIDLEYLPSEEASVLLRTICTRLTGEEAAALARACDYLPLALRISASLLRTTPALAVSTYLAQLADERQRLALLRDPDMLRLDVGATLALSYAQLDTTTQGVFRQLGVIAAGFGTDLAQAVVVAPVMVDVEQMLHHLLRRNLVMYDAARERWRLHDLVRDLARRELEMSGETEVTYWRYTQAVLTLAQHLQEQYLVGGDAAMTALARFDTERPHIEAAWTWGSAQAGTSEGDQLLLDLALATTQIAELRWEIARERLPRLQTALIAARRHFQPQAEGRLLLSLGRAAFDLGAAHHAITAWERALALFQTLGDRARAGRTLGNLGTAYDRLGQLQHAIRAYTEAQNIFRSLGDRRGEGQVLGNLGVVYADLGAVQLACSYLEQALAYSQAVGDRRFEGMLLQTLSDVSRALSTPEEALTICGDALAIARDLGDRGLEGTILTSLGNAAAALGEHERAAQIFDQALTIVRELGDCWSEAECCWHYGLMLASQGERDSALALLHTSVSYLVAIGHARAAIHTELLAQLKAGEALSPSVLQLPLGGDPLRLGLASPGV